MIPKIIHLCWLSGDEYPPLIQKCLNSWKEYLSDYEIWVWDTNRFDINSTLWTKQAFHAKKYAFAADYIRLYALYTYGGIYLDSDVLVYKSFNDLLNLPYFIGQDYTGSFEPAVIGAEKGISWIGEVLNRYNNRSFVIKDDCFDMQPLPQIFFNELYGNYNFTQINKVMQYHWDGNNIFLFDRDFFNSRNSIGVMKTPKSYCSHNYAGGWVSKKKDLKSRIKRCMPMWIIKLIYDFSHATYKKKEVHRFDPIYLKKDKSD